MVVDAAGVGALKSLGNTLLAVPKSWTRQSPGNSVEREVRERARPSLSGTRESD